MDLDREWKLFYSKLQKVKPTSNGIESLCPAHEDKKASLTASFTNEKILFKCQAGCSFESVVSALGMEENQFFAQEDKIPPKTIESTYRYEDKDGNHVMDVVRFKPKDFRPRRPDGRFTLEGVTRVPYRLPQMLKTIEENKTVLLVEGEKDCDNLAELGLTATTFPGGAGKWREDYIHWFKGASIACLPDNDNPGREGMQMLASKIFPVASSILWLELPGIPEKGDISDWLEVEGNDLNKFKELAVKQASPWKPSQLPTLKQFEDQEILHKDFYSPPGFVGDLADFIVDNSKYRQPILALSASLAYTGVLMGRKVATEENTRSNLFIAALARTGHGKESARAVIKRLDAQLGLECFGAEKVTSRAAIERILAWRNSSLFMIDEFGLFMRAIFNENAPKYAVEVMSTFMEIYTSSGVYYGQDKASRDEKRFEIDQPCCSIYGTSTPETFWSSLDSSKVRDGSMNRFTIFNAPFDRPERQRGKMLGAFPKKIIDRATYFKNMKIKPNKAGDDLEELGSPEPEIITYTDNAWKKFEALEDYCTEKIDSSGALGSMWVRTAEHSKKIALINCVADNKYEINTEHAEYGCELVKFLTKGTCNEINKHLADNEYERISKRIERMIRESGSKGISSTELYRATRFLRSGKHRKEVLDDLQASNLVICLREEGSVTGRRGERWVATEAL